MVDIDHHPVDWKPRSIEVKFKVAAVTTLAAVAIASAPVAAAAPNTNANGNAGTSISTGTNVNTGTPRNNIGQTISAIAKSGGGAAGVLGALVSLKPGNLGLINALQRVTAPKTTTSTATSTTTTAPSA